MLQKYKALFTRLCKKASLDCDSLDLAVHIILRHSHNFVLTSCKHVRILHEASFWVKTSNSTRLYVKKLLKN